MWRTSRLTRTPSLASQAMRCSPIHSCHTRPSLVTTSPALLRFGTPEWCSATTSHWSLNTGEPEEPGSVSVW